MAKLTRAHVNRLNTLMVKARATRTMADYTLLIQYTKSFTEAFGEEALWMNFSNPELVILEEATKALKTRK